ncbi:type II secretion system F family protein [Thiomicrorhabdus hydrogeniphila]
MDLGFVIVALAIIFPILLVSFTLSAQQQRQKQQQIKLLMLRVGMQSEKAKTLTNQLMLNKDKNWFIWLTGLFKKAGISNKRHIILLMVIQAFMLFLSAFVLSTQFNTLTDKHIISSVLLPLFPAVYLFIKIRQRQTELRKQFPEMLDSIVRSLHSGYGIDGAIGAIGEDMNGALAEEMKEVNKQLVLGISMRDILREFQRRVALPEAQYFVITLIIQRETGGQLASILAELSRLMRRRDNFQAKLKTLTAESRFTAWFIGGAPILYILYKYVFDKDSMNFFLYDPLGFKLFIFSLIMIAAGILILRYMLKMRF